MVQIDITKHAVERYRERVTTDPQRDLRKNKEIRRIMIKSVQNSRNFRLLEEKVFQEPGLVVSLYDSIGKSFGEYILQLSNTKGKGKGIVYSVLTIH